jgi:hypothetical protein
VLCNPNHVALEMTPDLGDYLGRNSSLYNSATMNALQGFEAEL